MLLSVKKRAKKTLVSPLVSLGLLAALSGSAEAFCVGNACHTGGVSVGALYSDYGDSATMRGSGYGGFANIYGQTSYANRLLLRLDLLLGGGKSSLSGTSVPGSARDGGFFQLDTAFRLGFNAFSKTSPLYITPLVGLDGTIRGRDSVNRILIYTGLELAGEVAVNPKFSVLYGVGYSWIFSGGYQVSDDMFRLNGYNSRIHAHLGFAINGDSGLSYTLKVSGRYYLLNDTAGGMINGVTANFSAVNSATVMLEFGIRGLSSAPAIIVPM